MVISIEQIELVPHKAGSNFLLANACEFQIKVVSPWQILCNMDNVIGRNLKVMREANDLTQEQMASYLGTVLILCYANGVIGAVSIFFRKSRKIFALLCLD